MVHWNWKHLQFAFCWGGALVLAATADAGGPKLPWQSQTTLSKLASKIDRLEKHIEVYGTIVPKTPDVWGEARLTKFRVEFEEQMAGQKSAFGETINAAISRSDQAFLTSALTLQAAISGSSATLSAPSTQTTQVSETLYERTPTGELVLGANNSPIPIGTRSGPETTSGISESALGIPTAGSDPFASTVKFRETKLLREGALQGFGDQKIALEPVIALDQRARYLNHLHQLRRNNDGDDRSDSPGYALHLVRVPVSVLPGRSTESGYGAEITISARPHIHDKLLETTFRELVVNDLVDQLSFPLVKFLDSEAGRKVLVDWRNSEPTINGIVERLSMVAIEIQNVEVALNKITQPDPQEIAEGSNEDQKSSADSESAMPTTTNPQHQAPPQVLPRQLLDESRKFWNQRKPEEVGITLFSQARNSIKNAGPAALPPDTIPGLVHTIMGFDGEKNQIKDRKLATVDELEKEKTRLVGDFQELARQLDSLVEPGFTESKDFEDKPDKWSPETAKNIAASAILRRAQKLTQEAAASVSLSPSRRSRLPFPPSRLIEVLGANEFLPLAELYVRLADQNGKGTPLLILDVQKSLAEEIRAALAYVDQNPHLWTHCDENLARQVRDFNHQSIETLRAGVITPLDDVLEKSHTAVLVWAVLVESSLLNERLIDDMKQMQAAKNCSCLTTEWLPYFLPNPEPHVVEAFRQYVECRWPIQVFAVDPITNDQNVAESVSIRREMQLALSVALANGQINVQHFLRYARALALDQETIALNRTAVGFSHGGDTFGWRFYPRVQAPPSRGNLAVATRELFVGGMSQDHLLRSRRLEPGMRECTAIVLMPGFVPYVTFDTRTNWFRLDNPARRQFDLKESIAVSEDITSMRDLVQACVKDQHLYRPDEVRHLQLAVEQLERRLPLQTAWVQLPFENTLGGFEFFNGGSPDLSPELHGFYGEPGLRAEKDAATSIFLVGDNFSVHETSVIVGNKAIDSADRQLLSRQVMRVTVKGPIEAAGKKIDIHVATPYGVSNHLDVPLIPAKPDAAATEAAKKAVAEHVEQQHVDRLVWKNPPELSLVYDVRANSVSAREPKGDFARTFIDNATSLPLNRPLSLQLVFRYSIIVPGEPKPRKVSIVNIGNRPYMPTIALKQPLGDKVAKALIDGLLTEVGNSIPADVTAFSVKLETFARVPGSTEVQRVDPDLTFAVDIQFLVPSRNQGGTGETGGGIPALPPAQPPVPAQPAEAARLQMELRERDQAALPLLAP